MVGEHIRKYINDAARWHYYCVRVCVVMGEGWYGITPMPEHVITGLLKCIHVDDAKRLEREGCIWADYDLENPGCKTWEDVPDHIRWKDYTVIRKVNQ